MRRSNLEYQSTDSDKIFFLHIPKTAGTSFIAVLDSFFRSDQIFPQQLVHELSGEILETFSRYRFFRGHFPYPLMCQLLRQRPVCLTVCRDPIERYLSNFAYIHGIRPQDVSPGKWQTYEVLQQLNLEQFIGQQYQPQTSAYNNLHTQLIASPTTVTAKTFDPAKFIWPKVTEKELLRAKQLIVDFEFFGLTEKFQDTLFLLSYTFGWKPMIDTERRNVSSNRTLTKELAPQLLDRIAELNTLDLELYNYVQPIFEARVSQMARELLELYGTQGQVRLKLPLPNAVMFELLNKHHDRRKAERQRKTHRMPNRPYRIVICCGMQRSGSTWQYLVASDLMERQGRGARIGFMDGAEFIRQDLAGFPEKRAVVLKCHRFHQAYARLIASGEAKVIYSYRDIREIVSSLLWKYGWTFEQLLASQLLETILEDYDAWTSIPTALIQSYDLMIDPAVEAVQQIASYLDLDIDSETAHAIADKYNREANRARTQQIKQQLQQVGLDLTQPGNALAHDPQTLLHWNHIRPANQRNWRAELTPAQLNALLPVIGNWLIETGFADDETWVADSVLSETVPLVASLPNERVIEIPWALLQLPQSGRILDVGSCEATYLSAIQQPARQLHCLDPRACPSVLPVGSLFFQQSLIGNTLPVAHYDAILILSTLEHIGLPCYGQRPFTNGDRLALAEIRRIIKPIGRAIFTVPAGQSKITTWYRQYSPTDLDQLFSGWSVEITYWGFDGKNYTPIEPNEVVKFDYRDRNQNLGAGALAGIIAYPQ